MSEELLLKDLYRHGLPNDGFPLFVEIGRRSFVVSLLLTPKEQLFIVLKKVVIFYQQAFTIVPDSLFMVKLASVEPASQVEHEDSADWEERYNQEHY